jgi:hypothetical protein
VERNTSSLQLAVVFMSTTDAAVGKKEIMNFTHAEKTVHIVL